MKILVIALLCLGLPMASPGQSADTQESFINFSFDQVSIPAFVKLVGDITGRKFVVAEDVEGKITVVSPRIRRQDAYSLFVSILESAECSVVEDGEVCRVVRLPDRTSHMAPVVGVDEDPPSEGLVTKVFRLEHVRVTELRKVLESKVAGGKGGAVGAIEETNHLVVTDTAESIRRIEKIIAEVDRPGLARVTEVILLKFAGAEDLADELNRALVESQGRGDRLKQRLPAVPGQSDSTRIPAAVVASPHSNSLILVGAQAQVNELRNLIGMMDVDTPSGRGRLNAIFLKYISAEEAAEDIGGLLKGPEGQKQTAGFEPRRIAIQASKENNALLVDASPGDFEVVRQLIEQLDRVPEQVHIEVLIAEISVGDSLDLGVDMAAVGLPDEVGSAVVVGGNTLGDGADAVMNVIQQGIFPGGLTVGVAHGSRVDAEGNVVVDYPGIINIKAIKKDSRFRIRSNPSLMAQNNKEATVSIVHEIPILKSTISSGAGTARDIIQNIERVDVGIKLKLTPHVIPGGEVRMVLNPAIEAVIDPGPSDTRFTPTIAKREVSTTVTVPDGETIVIAGLTREDQTRIERKVPLLGSIPLIGWLFRETVDSTEKSNVLILVTPRIVTDIAVARQLMQDMETRSGVTSHEAEQASEE